MSRNRFDLSHYSMTAMKIGRLMTVSQIPTIAGDSIEIGFKSLMRLSPLRRALSVDCQVDVFFFWTPMRHVYGDLWIDMMRDGVDSDVVFPNREQPLRIPVPAVDYLAHGNLLSERNFPRWMYTPYNEIYERYFRHPKFTPEFNQPGGNAGDKYDWTPLDGGTPVDHDSTNSAIDSTDETKRFGYLCGRMKTPWTTGIVSGITDDDHHVPAVADQFDILDLAKVQARYKSEIEREYFNTRYNDVLRGSFGSGVNIDADQRSELILRKTMSIQGFDLDGSDDASLGTHSGKGIANINAHMRRRFFNEHGVINIMILSRFPTIAHDEKHPLKNIVSPTYLDNAGDYDIMKQQPPQETFFGDWHLTDPGGASLGEVPAGQWYRHHPNEVHGEYFNVQGFPFLSSSTLNTQRNAVYHIEGEYDEVFQTEQLGHVNGQCGIYVDAIRRFPTARESIMAGTRGI